MLLSTLAFSITTGGSIDIKSSQEQDDFFYISCLCILDVFPSVVPWLFIFFTNSMILSSLSTGEIQSQVSCLVYADKIAKLIAPQDSTRVHL